MATVKDTIIIIIIIISLILTMTSIKTYPRRGTSKHASPAVSAVKGLPEEKKEKGADVPSAGLVGQVVLVRF
jgi:flagellar basal body-associated protein FliL